MSCLNGWPALWLEYNDWLKLHNIYVKKRSLWVVQIKVLMCRQTWTKRCLCELAEKATVHTSHSKQYLFLYMEVGSFLLTCLMRPPLWFLYFIYATWIHLCDSYVTFMALDITTIRASNASLPLWLICSVKSIFSRLDITTIQAQH